MFLRALVTSALLALIYSLLSTFIATGNLSLFLLNPWIFLIYFSMGFLSIISFIYGRKLRRNFGGETGSIKWFDPSKGYGFLIRDKGGDLFVHLRSVKPEDRRKLKESTRVRFKVQNTEKGPQAENIRII
tara:strand:+ start:1156 stop:1545 length:390 start_codon:yes stop_codon:yes gene_type:complete